MEKTLRNLGVALCALVFCATTAAAQVTTGNILGTVVDASGAVLPGATIVATHTPTGTMYEGVTGTDGRFQLLNVRVGGPYTVKTTMSGFKDREMKDIMVTLGEDAAVSVKLELASMATSVDVVATVAPIDLNRAGTGASISNDVKESMPTISRSIFDVVRGNPYFNQYNTAGSGASSISVAGRNNRYNNIAIDGAVNNDIFGLAASGTPEGQTGSQPISLDAIQEIQLLVSPYDVRQGGFSGGGINAITRGGTNAIKGSLFFFARDQRFVGKGFTGIAVSKFDDKKFGGTVGGPIVKNRAFFFGSYDGERQNIPAGFSVDSTGNQFGTQHRAAIEAVINQVKTAYGYDPGPNPLDEFIKIQNNDKYFFRGDFNLRPGQQLTLRHNFVDADADTGTPSSTQFLLPDNFVRFRIKTHSTVAQLNSTFGKFVNELRVARTQVRNRRGGQPFEQKPFPNITVTIAASTSVRLGREVSSTQNELDQDNIEINDDLLFVRGKHTFTVGTHNEFFKFRNVFIQNAFGTYSYTSLANFQAGQAQAYTYFFSNTADPLEAARFSVRQLGFYAGDQWRVRSNLTLTGGVRVDIPRFNAPPKANATIAAQFPPYKTDTVPEVIQWSPRIGFNWDLRGDGKMQVRGGVGIFAGRTPYVWMSNQYSNNGIDFTRLSISNNANNRIPFVADAFAQSKNPTGGTVGTNDINLVDPDYKFPEMLRGNLAYDHTLPFGLTGTAELLWSRTRSDVKYTNINFIQNGTSALDSRSLYTKQVSTLANVILLSNIKDGGNWSTAYEVRRPFKNGWYASGSWIYGRSRLSEESQSSVALTSWQNVFALDQYNPPITRSDFDMGHRFNFSASYEFPLFRGARATASAYYSGQSGRPYSIFYSTTDVNGDGVNFNDLFYMPNAGDAVTYTNGAYSDLLLFMQADDCTKDMVGKVIPRNACRAPWTNTLDGKFSVALPFRRVKAEITLDVLNLINLFDSKGGLVRFLNFNSLAVFPPTVNATTRTVTAVNLATITNVNFQRYQRDDLRSRWQMQLGGRVRF